MFPWNVHRYHCSCYTCRISNKRRLVGEKRQLHYVSCSDCHWPCSLFWFLGLRRMPIERERTLSIFGSYKLIALFYSRREYKRCFPFSNTYNVIEERMKESVKASNQPFVSSLHNANKETIDVELVFGAEECARDHCPKRHGCPRREGSCQRHPQPKRRVHPLA